MNWALVRDVSIPWTWLSVLLLMLYLNSDSSGVFELVAGLHLVQRWHFGITLVSYC